MSNQPEPCRLCGAVKTLVQSHTVPKALHLDAQQLENTGEVMRVYSDNYNYGKRSPTGEYDRMLCDACEKRFLAWDTYGIEFVRTHKSAPVSPDAIGFSIDGVDYTKLKLFVLGMLWRANESSRPIFKRINLGEKWRTALTQAILAGDPGPPEFFAIIAALFKSDIHKSFLVDPHPERFGHINYVRFYIYGGFTFLIKVDQRPSDSAFAPGILAPGKPLAVILRNPSPSEQRAFSNILGASEK
jgi:hypothetical protein